MRQDENEYFFLLLKRFTRQSNQEHQEVFKMNVWDFVYVLWLKRPSRYHHHHHHQ